MTRSIVGSPAAARAGASFAAFAPGRDRKIDIVVVYKVDRLTRSLADFAKPVEPFEPMVSRSSPRPIEFNTTTCMGRLTLNVLLSLPSSSARSPVNSSAAWCPR
jgi:hypothetical protein